MAITDFITNLFKRKEKNEQRGLSFDTIFPNSTTIDYDKALTLTAVWCAIRLLSESVSSLPCSVYTKQPNGDKLEDPKNRIYDLIKYRPNRYQNKITFFEFIMLSI